MTQQTQPQCLLSNTYVWFLYFAQPEKKTFLSMQIKIDFDESFEYFQQILMHHRLFYTWLLCKKVFHMNGILGQFEQRQVCLNLPHLHVVLFLL